MKHQPVFLKGRSASNSLSYRLTKYFFSVFALVSSFVLLVVATPATSAETFTMAFAHKPSQEPQYLFYERIYTEAFKELGYRFRYKIFPSKRASLMANEGLVDGEPQRVFKYGTLYPNLIRVEEPIFTNRTLAFSTDPTILLDGLESLKDTDYRVDYQRGSVWSKEHLEPLVKPKNLTAVTNGTQGLQKVMYGRTDIYIGLEAWTLKLLDKEEFKESIISVAGVVGQNHSYPYLHKSHAEVARKLAKLLKEMKKNGRYKQILLEAMPFLDNR